MLSQMKLHEGGEITVDAKPVYRWGGAVPVQIKCPSCGHKASFEFARIVKIHEKKDVAFFQESDQFEYAKFKGICGHRWHAALFYIGLHGSTSSIKTLPEGYQASDWQNSERYVQDRGSVYCPNCHLRAKHALNWPSDAYYQIDYKNEVLWAFNEESARAVLELIESTDRKAARQNKWYSFLRKIPSIFLKKEARERVIKKIQRLL